MADESTGVFPVGDNHVRLVVLMPMRDATLGQSDERVVVNDMAIRSHKDFVEADDRFDVKKIRVGRAVFEHPVAEHLLDRADLDFHMNQGEFHPLAPEKSGPPEEGGSRSSILMPSGSRR